MPSEPDSTTATFPTSSTILKLPVELLTAIVQYIAQADDLCDYFHLGLTCKSLYATLWARSTGMWRQVWITLYDDPARPLIEGGLEIEGIEVDDASSSIYMDAIKERLLALRKIRYLGKLLEEDAIPWNKRESYENYDRSSLHSMPPINLPRRRRHMDPSVEDIRRMLLKLVRIGKDLSSKNLYWVHRSTTSNLWAYATYLWFNQPTTSLTPNRVSYCEPEVLYGLYNIIAHIGTYDPYILEALYRNKYESFRYIRGTLFRDEDHDIYQLPCSETLPLAWFPWSMCQVFFLALFCGPNIIDMDITDQHAEAATISFNISEGDTSMTDESEAQHTSFRWTPSWFNWGTSDTAVRPIPLEPMLYPHKTGRYSMQGQWAGYYSYQVFVPADVEVIGLMNETHLGRMHFPRTMSEYEYAARGLCLDQCMAIRFVDWTTDMLGQDKRTRRCGITGGQGEHKAVIDQVPESLPFYLSADRDVTAMKLVDRIFQAQHAGQRQEHPVLNDDDLEDKSHWAYQRVFSGQGHDAIGVFGIRGVFSERTGLVRMVKSYFDSRRGLPALDTLCFEFGREYEERSDQLSYVAYGDMITWYYRGHLDPRGKEKGDADGGAGVLGIWHDDDASGPFWMYRVDIA
ncbi:hypothetical protein BG011_006192 [Mortierella polycephala]|uniref:F-box domain-containing protein n=1 Tax=Mortierella polycephala TaxID=41804 RepID=A0A9P6PTI0_9FUNG|nr:hypothetical protein BG011_006192 [Mortierella polycephala]